MPDAPQNANATSEGPGRVLVTWHSPTSGTPTAYEVLALPTKTLHLVNPAIPPSSGKEELRLEGLEPGATYTFEVRAVDEDGSKSEPSTTRPVVVETKAPSGWWMAISWLIVLLILAGIPVALELIDWPDPTRHGVAFACGVVGLALAILTLIGGPYGLGRAVVGADRRVSTSYLTTGLWTVLVAFILAYLTSKTWFDGQEGLFDGFLPTENADGTAGAGTTAPVWDDYLVLLGGPFAAMVFARGIVATKVQNQTVQKTVADDGTASLRQALTDDSGKVDLVDSQYFLFNIVAFAYVIVAFATHDSLPQIPAILLALTGTSAATYVVNKAISNSSPIVTSVIPSSFRPGERIVITGTGFTPSGPSRPPVVTIGGKQALVESPATSTRVTAIVPPGTSPGAQELLITTAARATSDARLVEVLADQPQILAIEPPTPTIGKPLTIRGVGFTSALDPTTTCSVLLGTTLALTATPTKLSSGVEEITVAVPQGVDVTGDVDIVVKSPRLTSSLPAKVKFKAAET